MLINILVLCLFKLVFSLDLTIVDYNQKIIVPLQHYFNNSLEYNFFRINTDKSIPQNITQYLSFQFSNKFFETSFAEMSVVISQNTTFRLNQHIIYQTLSILTQPIKIFLTQDTLMMVIFDDQLQDKSILLSSLNLSQNYKKTLSCKEQIFDPQFFKLFVQCKNKQNNDPITILINLQKDVNLIVNAMVYVKSFNTKGYLQQCDRKVLIGDHIASNEIMLYCPYSKNNLNHFTSIFFSASLDQKSKISQVNLTVCSIDCCYAAETIIYRSGQFYMVTNISVLHYKSNICEPKVKYTDFISMRIGSIKQQQDIYVLTQQYLIMVYPRLTNEQKIDVTTDNMEPVSFTITKNYIIIQLLNDTTQQSILKVYKIVNYHPKLIDIVNIDYSQILFATENYLQGADYMYLYTQDKNILSTAYYKGPQLTIEAKTTFRQRKSFLASVENYDNTTLITNQTLNISIFVYNYNNSDYFIQYNQLRYSFQQSFVKIPLRDGVIGPLVEFYTIDQISLQKQYLNGIYLINMEKAIFYQQNIDSVVGIMLERLKHSPEKLMVKFAQKNIQNNTLDNDNEKDQYILLYECSLIYNISVFQIEQCFNDNIIIINQSYINIRQLKGFYYIQNLNNDTDSLNYLLYDTDYILLCNDTYCQKKQRTGGDIRLPLKCKTLKLINTKQDVFLMFLRNDSKSLTLFSLGDIDTTFLTQILVIDEKKLKDLNNDKIRIVDFYIDWQFQSFLVIHLSNSKVFVIQKQQDKAKTICHATSLIQIANITECKQFVKTFYVGEGVSKIIILCSNFSQYHLVEFTINNLFDVQKTRQYPLYDYKVNNNSDLHFCDNQFLYIAVTGSQPYYLVYNTHSITPNSLMYRIPTDKYYHLVGNIRNIVKSKGYGLIDKWAYIVSNSYYQGNLQVKNSSKTIVRDTASFAVRNNKDQLNLVQFELFINFSKSNVNYQIKNPNNVLPRQALPQFQKNESFNMSNLNGPIFQVDLSSSCKDWPEIQKQNIFTKQTCITNNKNSEQNQNQEFGIFLGEVSLGNINIVITKKVTMCIINKTIINYLQHKPEVDNCTISDFSSPTQKQVIFVCVYRNSDSNFKIVKVSDECEMTFKSPKYVQKAKYFNLKAYYPNLIIQVPILLGQIKNYQKCIFDEKNQQISNCKIMTYGLQNTFLSSDYDIFKDYGLILQKGIGIFNLLDSHSHNQINSTDWITEQKLQEFGLFQPYKYVKLNSISDKGQMIIEIANQNLALQLKYNSKQIKLFKSYQQYVGCRNLNFKSIDTDIYKIKICQFLKFSAQILDETIPIQQHSVRLAQFYLKQKQHNYPVSMFNLIDPKTSLIYISSNQILQITSNTSMCYYNLRPNISWILTFHMNKYDTTCENSFNLKNNHTSKSIPISYTIEQLPPTTISQIILRVLVHVPFILLLIAFPVIKFCSKRQKKSLPNPLSKKVSYNKNFYSNDFEDQLKDLHESLIQSKI